MCIQTPPIQPVSPHQAAHLTLPPRTCRVFDECTDIVDADLVLVMDSFDYAALLREVAVFDAINPCGRYSQRVKHVAGFAPIAPAALRPVGDARLANYQTSHQRLHTRDIHMQEAADAVLHPDDIPDPLYRDGRVDSKALRAMVQALRRACRGVLAFLEAASLHADDVPNLSAAIASGVAATDAAPLACPLGRAGGVGHAAHAHRHPVQWRPLWLDDADLAIEQQRLLRTPWKDEQVAHTDASPTPAAGGSPPPVQKVQALYTLDNGVILPLHRVPRRRGYWCDLSNTLYELVGWMRTHEYGSGYMPASTELKETGAHQLAHAIMHHGGTHEVPWVSCMNIFPQGFILSSISFFAYHLAGIMVFYSSLLSLTTDHQRTTQFARLLGLKTHRHASNWWTWQRLRCELKPLLRTVTGDVQRLPSQRELLMLGMAACHSTCQVKCCCFLPVVQSHTTCCLRRAK